MGMTDGAFCAVSVASENVDMPDHASSTDLELMSLSSSMRYVCVCVDLHSFTHPVIRFMYVEPLRSTHS